MLLKCIFGIIFISICLSEADEKILFAAVIYRHGDRTPVSPYPNDPWKNESLWPVKFGQLTNIGKRQHFGLGQWLRERYSHLLSDKFNPTEIHVRSTDVDRTLMSAQVNLAGMFPPHADSVWDNNLMWQPIPVHTMPEKDDQLLAMKKNCINYNKEMNQLIQSKAYKERLKNYKGLMDYLSVHTGMKIQDYNDINDIYNTLQIEELYNFSLPNWTQSVYPKKLRGPACYSFKTATYTPLMARLMVSPIVKQITLDITHALYHEENHRRVSIYSGHDFTVANILNAMGVFDGNCPVYTSTIMIELVLEGNGPEYIRILYRNSTEIVEPYWLEIPECGKKCTFDKFIRIYHSFLTVDWDRDCGNQSATPLGLSFFVGLGIFATMYIAHKIHIARVSRYTGTPPASYPFSSTFWSFKLTHQ